ncbi:DUF937 domain-containing protein [Sphingomonas sp. PAMC 26605]|uniref:DUF937 domain-containing protein n=1 Tax=Sphingomonas sp. PAMC 26605 TaxID=1112214 RepID=UPI00026CAD37|nr:DUF937 domain-containing protein [Sphingomonas sp. PAMC 26605]
MQGLDEILGSSGTDLGSLAARFGLSPEQAKSAMSSLLPAVAGGFQQHAQGDTLGPVEETANSINQPDTASGNDVLGHIFGGKDVSRQVADHAAGQSGVSSTVLKAMLPIVAAMVAKHLAAQPGGGGIGGVLGSLLGAGTGAGSAAGGLGGLFGADNPLSSILDRVR